jgi:hypothetical protein
VAQKVRVAKSPIPDALERRHLVEREIPAPQALRIAEAYLAEGRTLEAVDFLRKAGASERLAELRREAVAGGDAFLLRSVAAASGEPPTREEWVALAEGAQAAGRQRYADEGRRQALRRKE